MQTEPVCKDVHTFLCDLCFVRENLNILTDCIDYFSDYLIQNNQIKLFWSHFQGYLHHHRGGATAVKQTMCFTKLQLIQNAEEMNKATKDM